MNTQAWFTITTENAIMAFATEREATDAPDMRYAFADRSNLETILSENDGLASEILVQMPIDEPKGGFAALTAAKAAKLIWATIQPLTSAVLAPEKPARKASVSAPSPVAAAKPPRATKKANAVKKAPKGKKAAAAKNAAKPAKSAKPARASGPASTTGPREGSKAAQLVGMLQRKHGATLAEIMKEFGWLAHTTRALLSAGGSLRKMGITVESFKPEGGERTYRISA